MGISKIPNNLQVVESGHDYSAGYGWDWKKYSDGRAELWGYFKDTITSKTQWGGIVYYSNKLCGRAFPNGVFVNTPYCIISPGSSTNDGWITNPRGLSNANTPWFYHVTVANYTGYDLAYTIYAEGRWK